MLQFQERKSHNRNHATDICALALDRWNGLLIGLSQKTVQGQQSRGSSGCIPQSSPIQAVLLLCVHQLGFNESPSGLPDQPGSPYLHWDLPAQVSLWKRSDGLSHLSSRLPTETHLGLSGAQGTDPSCDGSPCPADTDLLLQGPGD